MQDTIVVHGYRDNTPSGARGKEPREPLVQVLAWDYQELQSVSFSPETARKVATALLAAAAHAESDGDLDDDLKIEIPHVR